ncbi:MAG: electron transfer flavoprotein subunit alpha/FixB family protein [Bacteroidetes bacterium]|nr:electron transfer flavoprotein subunit alpha/FixB family protein [Bacteroidota bacterium]MCH7769491.1 electron transfer flavoprotein subunit alpha/FixB family protein [Bacteroidota bacterium]MCH9028482.1 electron transfer flavoprotein subunit alpha/FixB family protein [Bacteroidota bacterium]
MANKILAILEQREGLLKRSAFEAVTMAKQLAAELNLGAEAVVVGNEVSNINDIGNYGIDKVIHLKSTELENYSSSGYRDAIADYAKETDADYLLFANTALGKDLAPRLAVALNAGCLIDCVKLDSSSGELIATRPVYAGKALIDVKCNSTKKVITIRPNVFKAKETGSSSNTDVKVIEINSPNLKCKVVDFKKSEGKLDVAEADIIVSGGRGLKGPENFHLIEELANSLGAAVGASRAVVDAGWRPHGEQVGQTGKTVSPSLYVACAISGAIQHLAGMSSAKYIVAINKDKDAPIFNIADYGIAGDVFEILPALTEEIKKVKQE